MGRRVLFTPVGGTDPISWNNLREGAVLQICRKYRPDLVCLYMSAEILEKHKRDNRYVYCLDKLGESIGKKMEYRIIERPELREVQQFDYFYHDFSAVVEELEKGLGKEDELILNVSSGTPAMKSCLMVLSSLTSLRCRVVQVATPGRKMNEHNHPDEDIEVLWEMNEDNNPELYRDRTEEVSCPWIIADQKKKLIRTHVLAYDYEAALGVHEQMRLSRDGSYVKLIEAAAQRKMLNNLRMIDILKEAGEERNEAFRPVRQNDKRVIFEYALALELKQKRGEYADFLRALTPIVTDLFIGILNKSERIRVSDYYYFNRDRMKRWDKGKIAGTRFETAMMRRQTWDAARKEWTFRDSGNELKSDYMYSYQLFNLIDEYMFDGDREMIGLCGKLRVIEEQRNRVAHEMVGVSDEYIKAKVGFDCREIMEVVRKLLFYVDSGFMSNWDSYDRMNEFILGRMEEELG